MVSDLQCTEVEVFLDKRVREMRQTAGANARRGATKKRDISRTLLSINLHFSVYPSHTNNAQIREGGGSLVSMKKLVNTASQSTLPI